MSKDDLLTVNASPESVALDLEKLCAVPLTQNRSPIDAYYEHAKHLIVRAASADNLMLRLFLLDLISATELFFRRVMSGVINLCPLAREHAARQMLSLGAVQYYQVVELGYGLLEHSALSGEGELKKKTRALLNLDIKAGSSADVAISEFERICHLRHAAIHSHGELSARNLVELGVPASSRLCITLTALSFQTIVVICHNAVRSYNQFVCNGVLGRWVDKGILAGNWDKDQSLFTPLHAFFVSTEDGIASTAAEVAYSTIRTVIEQRVGPRTQAVRGMQSVTTASPPAASTAPPVVTTGASSHSKMAEAKTPLGAAVSIVKANTEIGIDDDAISLDQNQREIRSRDTNNGDGPGST